MEIMHVENNAFFRKVFRQRFCELCPSAIVREAANGEEAMQELNNSCPQIIFMNLHLPGEKGLRLTLKIKKQFPSVRIAILTGYDSPEYREAAFQSGADRYFPKDSLSWDEVEEFIECHSAELKTANMKPRP